MPAPSCRRLVTPRPGPPCRTPPARCAFCPVDTQAQEQMPRRPPAQPHVEFLLAREQLHAFIVMIVETSVFDVVVKYAYVSISTLGPSFFSSPLYALRHTASVRICIALGWAADVAARGSAVTQPKLSPTHPPRRCIFESTGPTQCRLTMRPRDARRAKTNHTWSAQAGSRLKLPDVAGRSRLKSQSLSRTGENPPYGISRGTMETSASFEARSAPSSYPTAGGGTKSPSLPRWVQPDFAPLPDCKLATPHDDG
jgi:hypothetical protein